jgi:thymidylate synthase
MSGNIPVLFVSGKSLAEAYEKSLLELYKNGTRIKTQYDKPEDPASIDATMNITVEEPWSDPMIHKYFIGSIADLREYTYELEGLKDCIVRNENDKDDTRWEYLYSSRMTNYGTWLEKKDKDETPLDHNEYGEVAKYEDGAFGIRCGYFDNNQVEYIINDLAKCPYSRRAQMITWYPPMDQVAYDPPCYQRAWFRMLENDEKKLVLNSNISFRSNDAVRANHMNMFGFVQFIRSKILLPLQEKLGREIVYGRLNWHADSFHVYGSCIENFKERFVTRVNTTTFEDRVYSFHDADIQEMYHEQEAAIVAKFQDIKRSFGIVS